MAYQPKSYRKFLAGSVSAAVVASALAAPAGAAAASASFPDVPTGHWAYNEITALADKGIINGYSDGSFKPSQLLNRGQAAVLFTNALGLEVPENLNVFKDLKATSYFAQYAAAVEANGVFGGYANGNFGAGDNLTREQMASVLVRAFDLKDTGEAVNVADLSKAHASHQANVKILVQNGVSVVSDNNFRPKETVSRAQFATFLYRAMVLTGKINENADVVSVKAINSTTVEVKMAADVTSDVKAADFTIDGLTVSNAAVKQTDKSTVVLTTSAQEGKEYTLKIKGETAGKFTGVSAVVPSKVELVSKSVQGKLGQEVTVKAQVTVADGQSKAGIPVTFNVPGNNGTLTDTITKEATTDENGVATFTYTRYAAGNDTVTAYATGDRSKFSTGYVFWGVNSILTVEEVNTGSTVNNGANKTYKVKLTNPTTGTADAGKVLNVSFVENLNVTSDKASNAKVNGVNPLQLSNGSVTRAAQITTDSNGEATFTVSGTNTEVTPVVFTASPITGTTNFSESYSSSLLQATGAKVKFSAVQTDYTIELTRDGDSSAAVGFTNGKEYKIVVKDKDGKLAQNETVNVAFNENLDRVISTETSAEFVNVDADGNQSRYADTASRKKISVVTNSKGEATFVIGSTELNDYATPVAWIDINTADAVEGNLDEGEPKTVGAITYFEAEKVKGAELATYNEAGKKTTAIDGDEDARFSLALTNQSGKEFGGAYNIKSASYTVYNTGANDVEVGGQTVSPNRSYTVSQLSDLVVSSKEGKTTSVRVVATGVATVNGKDVAFTATESTAKFTATTDVAELYTGVVDSFDTAAKTITFEDKAPVKYAGETGKTYAFKGVGGTPLASAKAFTDILEEATGEVKVTYEVKDNVVTFYIVSIATAGGNAPEDTAAITEDLQDAKDAAAAADQADYTDASYAPLTAALALEEATNAQKVAKTDAIEDALNNLQSAVTATANNLTITYSPAVSGTAIDLDGVPATATSSDTTNIASVSVTSVDGTATTNGTSTLEITYASGSAPADVATGATLTITGAEVNGVTKNIVLTKGTDGNWTATPVIFK